MIRPFALLGFSAYAALALCMALGPENAWVLALLCLGLACGAAFVRVGAGFVCQRKGLLDQKELSEEPPMALSVFRGLFWAAAALAMAGLLCGMCALKWQQTEPLQGLEGRRLTVRAQVLDYPEERYHRYYYRLRVEALGEEDTLEPTEPFILRLSTTMPLRCQPCDWVECLVTFNAFDSSGGLYSTRNSRLADGFQAGGYLSQYTGVPVEENPALPFGEMLARLRNQVGRELDRLMEEISGYCGGELLSAAAYFHCRFENIHPFASGNGATGRVLMNYFLLIRDHPPLIVFAQDREEYLQCLTRYDRDRDAQPLAEFLKRELVQTWEA